MKEPKQSKDEHYSELIFCAIFLIVESICGSFCFYRYVLSIQAVSDIKYAVLQIITLASGLSATACLLFLTKALDEKTFVFLTRYLLPLIAAFTVAKTIRYLYL